MCFFNMPGISVKENGIIIEKIRNNPQNIIFSNLAVIATVLLRFAYILMFIHLRSMTFLKVWYGNKAAVPIPEALQDRDYIQYDHYARLLSPIQLKLIGLLTKYYNVSFLSIIYTWNMTNK